MINAIQSSSFRVVKNIQADNAQLKMKMEVLSR